MYIMCIKYQTLITCTKISTSLRRNGYNNFKVTFTHSVFIGLWTSSVCNELKQLTEFVMGKIANIFSDITRPCCQVNKKPMANVKTIQHCSLLLHAHARTHTPARVRAHARGCARTHTHAHAHAHTFNGPFPGLPRSAGTRKVKPIWILLKQETVSGSDIRRATCKSAPRSRQKNASTPPLSFLQAGCPSCRPTNSVKALKATVYNCNCWILVNAGSVQNS